MNRLARIAALLLLIAVPAFARNNSDNDRVSVGKSITIDAGETLPGDAVCVGCSVTSRGTVAGDIVAIGGSVNVDGEVHGDAVAIGGSLNLGPTAIVQGDVAAIGGHVNRDPAAKIHGEIASGIGGHHGAAGFLGLLFVAGLIFHISTAIILALLCYAIAGRQRIATVAETIRVRAGFSALAGIAVFVAAIILTAIFSHIHVHVASGLLIFLVWIAVLLASILGYTGLSAWIGRRVSSTGGPLAVVIIGALIVAILQAIPIVGFFFSIAFLLFALGSSVLTGYGAAPTWMDDRLGTRPPTA